MYLKEVTFNGFKSFADKTRIHLEPGITCIVGPNGCGKSNIVDAIRWVLGEKSAKALRGGNMQDVIFAGTDKRKPLSMCEVSLLFGDCESALGTGFHEVEIKRRVSVDGKSDYFINGKACRLKDIQNLFMDTGIGQQSYSFMAQGQIDQILSANPSERRSIFEEAAGITRYKTQRKEALSKLELVEQNLSRVSDVIEEVGRQIGSLKRQASKALRFQRTKHRLTHLDLAYNGFRYVKLEEAIAGLEAREHDFRTNHSSKKEALRSTEELIAALRAQVNELNANIQSRQQGIFELRGEKENAEVQAKYLLETRCNDLQVRIGEIEAELAEIQSHCETLERKANENVSFKQEQLNLVGSSDEIVKQRNDELLQLQTRLSETERSWNESRQDLLMHEGSITRLRSNCTTIEVELSKYQERHAHLTEQLYKLNTEREQFQQQIVEIQKTLEVRQSENARELSALEEEKQNLSKSLGDFRQLQSDIQNQDRELTRRTAQLRLLEDLQEKMEGFNEGAKAILKGKLSEQISPDNCQLLSKDLSIPNEYTTAMETLLGGAADTLVVQENVDVTAIFNELVRHEHGKATLQIPVSLPNYIHATGIPEFLVPAEKVVSTNNEKLRAPLAQFLANCYFAPNLSDFLNYWKNNPDFQFLFVATQHGELIDPRGIIYGGQGKTGNNASFLQRSNDIRTLKQEITEKQKTLDQLHEQREKLQTTLNELEEKIEERRARSIEIGQEVSTLQAEERAAQQRIEQNNREKEKSEKDLSDFEHTGEVSRQKLQVAQAALAEAEQTIESKRAQIAEYEQQIAQCRGELEQRRESLSEVRFELQEKKQRLEILERGLNEIEQQKRDASNRSARLYQELDRNRAQVEEAKTEATARQNRAVELTQQLEMLQSLLTQEKQQHDEILAQVTEKEHRISGERDQMQTLANELNKIEITLTSERNQCHFIREKFETDYQINIVDIDWKKELWEADTEFITRVNLDELEEGSEPEAKTKHRGDPTDEDFAAMDNTDWSPIIDEIKNLRERLHSMSDNVNLNAIAEYVELRERYNFLKTQSDDLWKSKEELLKAIDEINSTSLELFKNTFEQIRKNFHFTFEKLFGGGFADLQLLASDDPLDSGIEIIARPPGTKLRSLTLLSGGQKTMTAVSLLFAIYMVKPSPFCVLDELDAPLDEANIGRFTDIVRQFTQYSQFLVVSHSKRTIATADNIYGATMQERGVTRLISMRFNRETGEAVEATA